MIACCALRLAYLMLARVLSWLVLLSRSDTAEDVEILVLPTRDCGVAPTQQPTPQPELGRPRVLRALSRLLPTRMRQLRLVSPRTVLRQHTQVVARRWTYPRRQPGRPVTRQPCGSREPCHRL
jgi:hypothetical protein